MRKHKREYLVEASGLTPDVRCEALDARDAGKRTLSEDPHMHIRLTAGETYGGWPDREVNNRWNMNMYDSASTDLYRAYIQGSVLTAKWVEVTKGRVNWI